MKSHIFRLLILSFCLPFLACRKGDGDPLVSLQTRKARLCDEWQVKDMLEELHFATTDSGFSVASPFTSLETKRVLDGRIEVRSNQFASNGQIERVFAGTYKSKYTFNKDGTFKFEESVSDYQAQSPPLSSTPLIFSYTYEHTGTWAFLYSSDKDFENKERIALNYLHTRQTTIDDIGGQPATKIDDWEYGIGQRSETWSIKSLRNKELILERSKFEKYWIANTQNNGPINSKSGTIKDATISYTFTQ